MGSTLVWVSAETLCRIFMTRTRDLASFSPHLVRPGRSERERHAAWQPIKMACGVGFGVQGLLRLGGVVLAVRLRSTRVLASLIVSRSLDRFIPG